MNRCNFLFSAAAAALLFASTAASAETAAAATNSTNDFSQLRPGGAAGARSFPDEVAYQVESVLETLGLSSDDTKVSSQPERTASAGGQ